MKRFSPGERIELREVWAGHTWEIRQAFLVEDMPGLLAVYTPPAAPASIAVGPDRIRLRLPPREWSLMDATTPADRQFVGLHVPGTNHSVMLICDAAWRLLHWYINLESDLARTPLGFDYEEHILDLVVESDMKSWRWKDEDELAEAVERGLFTTEQAADFRAEGERALEWLLERRPPYDQPWEDWRPPADWA